MAYEIDAEEAGDEELRAGIAEAVNRGGVVELERWAGSFMDTGDLSVVFWTEVGQDC